MLFPLNLAIYVGNLTKNINVDVVNTRVKAYFQLIIKIFHHLARALLLKTSLIKNPKATIVTNPKVKDSKSSRGIMQYSSWSLIDELTFLYKCEDLTLVEDNSRELIYGTR